MRLQAVANISHLTTLRLISLRNTGAVVVVQKAFLIYDMSRTLTGQQNIFKALPAQEMGAGDGGMVRCIAKL